MGTKPLVTTALAVSLSLGVLLWRYQARQNRHACHGAIVSDWSESTGEPLPSVLGVADRLLHDPNLSQDGATLAILVTGDEKSANEPVMVADYPVPINRRALEGRHAADEKKQDIVEDLRTRLSKLPRTKRSPIFLAVKRGLEHLRSLGCTENGNCIFVVQTDGQENVQQEIKQALQGAAENSLAGSLHSTGIKITFCGIAETAGLTKTVAGAERRLTRNRDSESTDRLQKVWGSLFAGGDEIVWQPFCCKAPTSGSSSSP